MMLLGVLVEQRAIRFGDAGDFNIVPLQRHVEEAGHMAMGESDHADFKGWRCQRAHCGQGQKKQKRALFMLPF